MSGRNGNSLVHALALAASLAGGIGVSGMASAQDAILLEIIGAVRMASPEATRRTTDGQVAGRPQALEQPRREVREASAP